MLLLFANAFAAYATAAALVSQGSPILPLLIRVGADQRGRARAGRTSAYALALEMIVVVAVVMTAYALLLRRTVEVAAMSRQRATLAGVFRWVLLAAVRGRSSSFPLLRDARLHHPGPAAAPRAARWRRLARTWSTDDDAARPRSSRRCCSRCSPSLLMLVLLVPTMIWVRLRVPRATRLVEFLCLLPLTIPALVIVVGLEQRLRCG